MPTIKIDDNEYDTETLSQDAKIQLGALRAIDEELRRLQVQINIAQTARSVHANQLKAALADPMAGDTIKMG